MKTIFLSHPYRDAPEKNELSVRRFARRHALRDELALAPQIYLPQFIDETTERELALRMCLKLVGISEELRIYGGRITAGMKREIAEAERLGLRVLRGD